MTNTKPSKTAPIALLVVGVLLAFGPVWGLLGTVVGMIGAFGELSRGEEAEAGELASDMSVALYTTAVGSIMAPVGAVLIVLAVVWLKKVDQRRREFEAMRGVGVAGQPGE